MDKISNQNKKITQTPSFKIKIDSLVLKNEKNLRNRYYRRMFKYFCTEFS